MTSVRKIRLSQDAEDDLTDILAYSVANWGEARATAYKATLFKVFRELADFPALGRPRDEFGPGTRSLVTGQHVIIYRATDDEIIVARIVHVRRDLSRLMRQGGIGSS